MSNHTLPDAELLARAVAKADAETPTVGQVAEVLADSDLVDAEEAACFDAVESAIDDGTLVEEADAGAFGGVRLAETPGDDWNGTAVSDETTAAGAAGDYPPTIAARDWWVAWILDGHDRKRPVAPWQTGHAYPVEWSQDLDGDDRPETDFETARRWTKDFDLADLNLSLPEDAHSDSLRLGLILPADRPPREDRITLIDWDDVRDPETGEIHPVAAAYIEEYGGYVEVSRSGEGLHQFLIGGLRKRGKFIAPIDDEPFVGDDLPQVEIYDGGRHVAMTGDQADIGGDDAVPGQECIDELVREYADAEQDAGHRRYDPESGEANSGSSSGDGSNGGEVPEPETGEYDGPDLADLRARKPEDRSLAYHAVVEAFYRGAGNADGYAHILNWRLEGLAAALGEADGLSAQQIIDDLGGAYLDETPVEQGCRHETPHRVRYAYERAQNGRGIGAPSHDTLAEYGVLPEDMADAADPVAVLPLARLQALDDGEADRFARKRGVEWPDTETVRDELQATVRGLMRDGEKAVVDAPTGAGKSYQAATTPWREVDATGGAPVVHFHETTDARDEHLAASRDAEGVDSRCLLSGPEACPVAGGRHDPGTVADVDEDRQPVTIDGEPASEWFRTMTRERGIPFSVAHARARDRNDQALPELPCSPRDQACHSGAQWAGVPRDDDGEPTADIIHATHEFARVPSLRQNVNGFLDERPNFAAGLGTERARRAVTAFLGESEAGPDTWEELVATARALDGNPFDKADPGNEHATPPNRATYENRDRFMACVEALEYDPETEWYFREPDAHTLAAPVAQAVFRALIPSDPFDANGRATHRTKHHPPRFDDDARDDDFWNREWVTVVLDDTNEIRRVRSTPDFSGARSVVGLDARPNTRLWRRNVAPSMTREPVLDPEARRLWRVFERGLRVVQVGDAVRPKGRNGQYYDRDGDAALVEAIRDRFGDLRSGVVPKDVESEYRELLEAHGADDPDVLTFGSEKSRNDLAGESVGMVSHSLDPGDEHLLDLLAECELDATPERVACGTCDGTGDVEGDRCEACDGEGDHRAHGRGFDGPDADAAAGFLATVRENHLVQSAGRYARNPEDPDDGATVFVRSGALPEEYVDLQVPGVEWLASEKQRAVVEALQQREYATAAELAAAAEVSKEHVRTTLKRLVDADAELVECREEAGEHGAHLYRALAGLGTEPAVVDTTPEETANGGVWETSTWALAVSAGFTLPEPPTPPEQPTLTAFGVGSGPSAAADPGAAPPDPPG